jgi:hypothetical protein
MSDAPDPKTGVSYTPPPVSLMKEATRVVERTFAQLPKDANGAVIGVATEKGWNAAIAHRVGDKVQVVGWVGKSWGESITAGGAVKVVW